MVSINIARQQRYSYGWYHQRRRRRRRETTIPLELTKMWGIVRTILSATWNFPEPDAIVLLSILMYWHCTSTGTFRTIREWHGISDLLDHYLSWERTALSYDLSYCLIITLPPMYSRFPSTVSDQSYCFLRSEECSCAYSNIIICIASSLLCIQQATRISICHFLFTSWLISSDRIQPRSSAVEGWASGNGFKFPALVQNSTLSSTTLHHTSLQYHKTPSPYDE